MIFPSLFLPPPGYNHPPRRPSTLSIAEPVERERERNEEREREREEEKRETHFAASVGVSRFGRGEMREEEMAAGVVTAAAAAGAAAAEAGVGVGVGEEKKRTRRRRWRWGLWSMGRAARRDRAASWWARVKFLGSAFRWKRVNIQLSFFDDVVFKLVSVLEAIVLVSTLCFFYLFCGCHF